MLLKKLLQNSALYGGIIFNKFTAAKKKGGSNKSILVVKTDAIGDYVLFRNNLKAIKQSEAFKGYNITLLGNILWRDIAEMLDKSYIDNFIWIDHNLYKNNDYKKQFLKSLSRQTFDKVFIFHYSRSVFTEIVAFTTNAAAKVGFMGDNSTISPKLKSITNRLYSTLVEVPADISHEFLHLAFFTSVITATPLHQFGQAPYINKALIPAAAAFNMPPKYIVIGTGAGELKRRYPDDKMLLVIKQLLTGDVKLCFAGTKHDSAFVQLVKNTFAGNDEKIIDTTGKTSLPELLQLIKNALFVVCNESSMYHISIALNKKVVCFAGGGHFTRFADYNITTGVNLICHKMACYNCNWHCVYNIKKRDSYPCLQEIKDDNAILAINALINP